MGNSLSNPPRFRRHLSRRCGCTKVIFSRRLMSIPENILTLPYWHPDATTLQAASLLENQPSGTWFVRPSSRYRLPHTSPGHFSISYLDQQAVRHTRVRFDTGVWILVDNEDHPSFNTFPQLVAHLPALQFPLVRQAVATSVRPPESRVLPKQPPRPNVAPKTTPGHVNQIDPNQPGFGRPTNPPKQPPRPTAKATPAPVEAATPAGQAKGPLLPAVDGPRPTPVAANSRICQGCQGASYFTPRRK